MLAVQVRVEIAAAEQQPPAVAAGFELPELHQVVEPAAVARKVPCGALGVQPRRRALVLSHSRCEPRRQSFDQRVERGIVERLEKGDGEVLAHRSSSR